MFICRLEHHRTLMGYCTEFTTPWPGDLFRLTAHLHKRFPMSCSDVTTRPSYVETTDRNADKISESRDVSRNRKILSSVWFVRYFIQGAFRDYVWRDGRITFAVPWKRFFFKIRGVVIAISNFMHPDITLFNCIFSSLVSLSFSAHYMPYFVKMNRTG